MSSKKASWMRVLAFTVMMTLVLMTGATGLVVAEEGGLEGPPPAEKEIIQSPDTEGNGQLQMMTYHKPPKDPKVEIELEKWVNPDNVYFKDDTVTFFFKVTNKSEISLQNVILVDEDLGLNIVIGELTKYKHKETGSTFTTQVSIQLDPEKWDGEYYRNTATVTGTANVGDKVITASDSDSAKVELKPILEFKKKAKPDTVYFKDSTINYTFTVSNQSKMEITDVVLSDPTMGMEIVVGSLGTKHSNKSFTTTVAFDLSEDGWREDTYTNVATVQGTVPWGEGTRTVSAEASDTVKYQAPLTLEKTVNKEIVNFKDEKVTYTFKVWNNLPDKTIKNVVLTDPLLDLTINAGDIKAKDKWNKGFYTTTVAIDLSLIPGESWDGDQLVNVATATGCYEIEVLEPKSDPKEMESFKHGWPKPDPNPVSQCVILSAMDTATITYVPPMTLEKTVDPETVYSQDGIVNYTFKVWNNLPDKTIKNVVLTDPLLDLTMNAGDIKAKDKWNKGYYSTTVAIDLSLVSEESWNGNQLINEATATGCYEIEVWKPKNDLKEMETFKHGWPKPDPKPVFECATLTAVDTATLFYDPTTLTIKKDVPNVTDSAVDFDVLISWEEEWIDDEDPGDNEIPQYRTMVMNTTTKSIQGVISELEPYVMDAVPGVQYTVTEKTKAGYTTSEPSFQITLEPGEDGMITFVNTKDVIEEESSGGGGTNQGGNSGGGGDTDTNTIATVPDGQVPLAQDPVTVETLADLPIPLADVPQTGNNGLLNLWWMLLALSGFGILVVVYRKPEKL
jgi:uncharacterized repeat protein (TIGR01451 family)